MRLLFRQSEIGEIKFRRGTRFSIAASAAHALAALDHLDQQLPGLSLRVETDLDGMVHEFAVARLPRVGLQRRRSVADLLDVADRRRLREIAQMRLNRLESVSHRGSS